MTLHNCFFNFFNQLCDVAQVADQPYEYLTKFSNIQNMKVEKC
jgi:hypothetical protein